MKRRAFVVSVAGFSAVWAGSYAAAVDSNSVQIGINPNAAGGSGPFSQNVTQPGPIDISGSATGGGNSVGHGSAHVEYGVIRLTGDASGTLNTVCAGTIRDAITITTPGVATGSLGTVTYSMEVTGVLSTGASGGGVAAAGGLERGELRHRQVGRVLWA